MQEPAPREVLLAYGFASATPAPQPGLINRTFFARWPDGSHAVLQRLHPVFAPEVQHDIQAVTARLAERGMETPRVVRTRDGRLWAHDEAGAVWRVLSYVDGVTRSHVDSRRALEDAGALVGRFHRALHGFAHRFQSARPGAHDTAAHLRGLEQALARDDASDQARRLGDEILGEAQWLPLAAFAQLPARVCHGDLKISNVLFDPRDGEHARCLIDLDTVGPASMAYELGDALRSWCNPRPEDAPPDEAKLQAPLLGSALSGYARGAGGLLQGDEREALISGLLTVCIELSARFCRDVVEERYFGWDATRFDSLRAHNLVRARAQLALARAVKRQRAELERLARAAFAN